MKKLLYLLPLLLGILACGVQAQPTPNIAEIVNATLTAIAQNNPQELTPQTANTPVPVETQPRGNITYFWPRSLPEGFILSREASYANADGFMLMFINPSTGAISLSGGTEVNPHCGNSEDNPGQPVTVRGLAGCFPPGTGGGFAVEWEENGTYYSVAVMGIGKEETLTVAEQLESIDLSTFLARLVP